MLLGIYLALCILVGILGRGRKFGFVGFLLLSVLFTPLVIIVVLLMTERKPDTKANPS
jgi:hypothetical protein